MSDFLDHRRHYAMKTDQSGGRGWLFEPHEEPKTVPWHFILGIPVLFVGLCLICARVG
jgi:hypothetical protein